MGEKVEKIEEGAVLWVEDECAPDAESIESAWKRLFGEELDTSKAVREADYGDALVYEMPGGYIATMSYPGNTQIVAPPRRVPAGKVQSLILQPGRDAQLFDLPLEEARGLKRIGTKTHEHAVYAFDERGTEGHYAKNRSYYGSGETYRGTLYVLGPDGEGLKDERARRLLSQYSYESAERLEWALHRLIEQPSDADPFAFNTIDLNTIRWYAQEAYGHLHKCSCGGMFRLCYETARDDEYGFDLGSHKIEVCDACKETMSRLSDLEVQERRKALRALRLKPLSGRLLIFARKVVGVSRDHMAKVLRVTTDDIVGWEERDEFSKAPVGWLIDQLAATGVWG